MQKTTCQICGRPIKAKNGIIAHHGYKRPYKSGWQTDSCLGARFPPYEISHARIPFVMNRLENFLMKTKMQLNDLLCYPPEMLQTTIGGAYSRKVIEIVKPDNFNVHKIGHEQYMPKTYEYALSEIDNGTETQFDPDVAAAFKAVNEKHIHQWPLSQKKHLIESA